jgi:hypothetical protein
LKSRTRNRPTVFVLLLTIGLVFAGLYALAPTAVEGTVQNNGRSDVPPKKKPIKPAQPRRGGAPANDTCANAIAVTPATSPFTDSQNTSGATDEVGEPASTCTIQGNSVWYTFVNDTANLVVVDVSLCTSDFDTAVMVYQVDAALPCNFAAFVPVGCNDDSACGDGLQSQVQFEAVAGGTYKIQAGGFDGGRGNLTISITAEEIFCPDMVVNGTLGSGSPDWPSTSGVQAPARLFRDGSPSTCAAGNPCPGPFGSGSFNYDAYTFSNDSSEDRCVTVLFDPNLGGTPCSVNVHAIAYLGTYDPTNLCLNYVADVGSSDTLPFSFTVPAGMSFVVAIVANNPGGVGLGCNYGFTVRGNICGCTIACPANVTVSNDPNQCGAIVNYPAPTVTGNCVSVTCSPASGSFFPVGTTTVTCSDGTPRRGADGSCSFTVTVDDDQAPSIACPPNFVGPATSTQGSQLGAVVNYSAPTVSDNCPGVGAPTCVPASGSFFPTGTTTVACTVTDAAANAGSCSFTVTVGVAFTACYVDDATGNTISIVTDPTSPLYGLWQFTLVATNTIIQGHAEYVSFSPGRSLIAYDRDEPGYHMQLNVNFGAGTATARVTNLATRTTNVLRDRNITNDPPCQ